MKEVIILILLLLFLNTFLLLKNMNDNSKNSKCQPVEDFFESDSCSCDRWCPPMYKCNNISGMCESDYAGKLCGSPGDCADYEECKDGQCVPPSYFHSGRN